MATPALILGAAHLLVEATAADDAVVTVARRATIEAFIAFCAERDGELGS